MTDSGYSRSQHLGFVQDIVRQLAGNSLDTTALTEAVHLEY